MRHYLPLIVCPTGTLSYDGAYSVQWDAKETKYEAKSNFKGRGMELSELINWQGRHALTYKDGVSVH